MIIGEKEVFAIDVDISSVVSRQPIGDISFWVSGKCLASHTSGNHIFLILDRWANPIDLDCLRFDPFLDALSANQVFSVLHRAIYADIPPELPKQHSSQPVWFYKKFVPCAFDLEGFDDYFVIVAGRTSRDDRLIVFDRRSSELRSCDLPCCTFDRVVLSAIAWTQSVCGHMLWGYSWLKLSAEERDQRREAVRRANSSIADDWFMVNERAAADLVAQDRNAP